MINWRKKREALELFVNMAEWDTLFAFPIMTRFANIQSLAVADSVKKKKKVLANINESQVLSCRMLSCLESVTSHKENVQRIYESPQRKVWIPLRSLKNSYIYCGFRRSLSSSVYCGSESSQDFHTGLTGCCTYSLPSFETAGSSFCSLLLQLFPQLQ